MSRRLLLLAVPAWLAATAQPLRSGEGRYLAVLSDATRVEGDVVSGWHEYPGEARLDSTALDTSDRRLVWFRDRALPQYSVPDQVYGFVEFVSGDRFPGRVVTHAAPVNDTPEHFVVESELSLRLPEAEANGHFRVAMRGIRRIVFALGGVRQITPQTLYFRDGRRVSYRSLRWQADGLVVLTARGTQRVAFDELDEIHFPASDPWESYYRELAKLSPDGRSRLIRLETTDGLLATGSEANFDAVVRATAEERSQAQLAMERLTASQQSLENQRSSMKKMREHLEKMKEKNASTFNKLQEQDEKRSDDNLKRRRQQAEKQVKDRKSNFERQEKDSLRRHREAQQRLEKQLKDVPAAERRKRLDALQRTHEQEQKRREGELKRQLADLERQRDQDVRRFADDGRRRREQSAKNRQRSIDNVQRSIDRIAKRSATLDQRLQDIKRQIQLGPDGGALTSSSDHWYHKIRPAWCLDPLWIRFGTIRTRQEFAPHEMPLSRLHPAKMVADSGFGGIRPIQVDRNARGGPLQGAEHEHGWGFGVHADCELQFDLPDCARGFRTRVGLNRLAGDGGCARAAVFLGSRENAPLFQSEHLIGSAAFADTGRLDVSPRNGLPHRLILVADAAHEDRPAGTDPLNIRDIVDWIEPVIELDPAELLDRVGRFRK